ncbi:M16 family metallopeptidase [Streptomyces sp. NPDC002886]|uniref:M16 family metallopeptidase n=1 Tax=Streptomyces sp. NPDC002886 TaxID=3364667 RepID=UPI0036CF2BA7
MTPPTWSATPAPPAEPRFTAPAYRTTALDRGAVIGIDRTGTGDLAEARLLLPLVPGTGEGAHLHATEVEVAAEALRDALESAAGSLAVVRAEARGDRVVVSARTFTDDFADVCARIGDCLGSDALFDEGRVRQAAARVSARLAKASGHAPLVARARFLAAVYGAHPFGRTASAAEAHEVTGERLAGLLASAPAAARRAVAVGREPAAALLTAAERLLPAAPDAAPRPPVRPGPHPAAAPATVLSPGVPQTLIRLGGHVPGRTHCDYPALQLAVLMLGGYFGSRLTLILREREGLAYAPRAVLDPLGETAAFTLEADVRPDGTARALDLIEAEMDRLASGSFTAEDLRNAQNFTVGSMAMACSSRSGLASVFAGTLASGLPAQWLGGYEARVRALSVQDVARAAETHLRAPGLVGVLVSPAVPAPAPSS